MTIENFPHNPTPCFIYQNKAENTQILAMSCIKAAVGNVFVIKILPGGIFNVLNSKLFCCFFLHIYD